MNNITKLKSEYVKNNPRDLTINFDEYDIINIKGKEIYNCKMSGYFSKIKGEFHNNVVLSSLTNFISDYSDFNHVDWKDSNLRKCSFHSSIFDFGAFINCHIAKCNFKKCRYSNVSVTGTIFYETEFYECDLSNMILENCYFYNCSFYKCKTSNKLFEQCLFVDCYFNKTNIQIDTITENIGIEKSNIKNSKIRSYSIDGNYKFLNKSDLHSLCCESDKTFQNIFKFKIEYFLNPKILLTGSKLFDVIFDIKEWLPICKVQTTFLNLFKLFHDFLVILFEQNKLPVFAIYKFKELTHSLSEAPFIKNRFELYPVLIGYDISISRILGPINILIEGYKEENCIKLLVEGPLNHEYYYNKFRKFINGNFEILRVQKQNSPNLMEIISISSVIIQIVALFVTTRVKIELKRKDENNVTKKCEIRIKNDISVYSLDSIENTNKNNEGIVKYYFTQSSLPQYKLSYLNSRELGNIRKIIVDIHN